MSKADGVLPLGASARRALSRSEFDGYVLPHLRRCRVLSGDDMQRAPDDLLCTIYQHLVARESTSSSDLEGSLLDVYGVLNLDFKRISVTAISTAKSVQAAINAISRPNDELQVIGAWNAPCVCCKSRHKATIAPQIALEAYQLGNCAVPPFVDCEHVHLDGGGWCRCFLICAPKLPIYFDIGSQAVETQQRSARRLGMKTESAISAACSRFIDAGFQKPTQEIYSELDSIAYIYALENRGLSKWGMFLNQIGWPVRYLKPSEQPLPLPPSKEELNAFIYRLSAKHFPHLLKTSASQTLNKLVNIIDK